MENRLAFFSSPLLVLATVMVVSNPTWALTGQQSGASGSTYASTGVRCALDPVIGMAPTIQAGLYNPKKNASGTVSITAPQPPLNWPSPTSKSVDFVSPDATLTLLNGMNTVTVALLRGATDSYSFDASLSYPGQPNTCIPDTSKNTVNSAGDLEYAVSQKSYATITPGCALNPATGRAQPYINLFDNGTFLLNVSVNNVALTQLSSTRKHTPVFLAAGWNIITAENGTLSKDTFVRKGGDGTCTLP